MGALKKRRGSHRTSDFIFELIKASLDNFSLAIYLQRLKRVGFDVASNRPTAHKFHRLFQLVKVHGPNEFGWLCLFVLAQIFAYAFPQNGINRSLLG